jgi:hypothetical protein
MRTSALLSIALITAGISAAAVAQTNPFERFRRGQPAAKPMPQKPSNAGPIQDQGVHNAIHAAHQNQIVFTRIDTSVSGITEADIVTDFTLGQPMFFRVYTERSAVNAIAAANNLGAREVYADGVHYSARFTINGQVFDTVIFPGVANSSIQINLFVCQDQTPFWKCYHARPVQACLNPANTP